MTDPAQPIVLYIDRECISPWAFTAFVALTEKRLPFTVKTLDLARGEQREEPFATASLTGKIPAIRDGDYWLTESLAIAEYLAETYPFPAHPRLFPADLRVRGRARQLMLFLRTELLAMREQRPSTSVLRAPPASSSGRGPAAPLTDEARAQADRLVRVATAALPDGAVSLCDDWCIADADLAFALQRLRANGDPLPEALLRYLDVQWSRPSVRAFVGRER